jgi:hypothetical protein
MTSKNLNSDAGAVKRRAHHPVKAGDWRARLGGSRIGQMAAFCRLLLIACAIFASTAAADRVAESAPVVVELFTSQGCNSCPPADAFLGELNKRPEILALAFHVDYWNYIGWVDPFAKPWSAQRQRSYQKSLNERFVYTPQMVVAGLAQGVGAERDTIEGLIRTAATKTPPHPSLALRWRNDGALLVDVGDGTSPPVEPATIWLVGFDQPHTTKVLRGENEGTTATDYQAVRSYKRIGAWPGWALELVVPAADAKGLGNGGIAVLLQVEGTGPILAAARIALP